MLCITPSLLSELVALRASCVERTSLPSPRCGREGWLASVSRFIFEIPTALAAHATASRLGFGTLASLGTLRPAERLSLESK